MRITLWLLSACALVALTAIGGNSAAAGAKKHPHHHLHHALWELRDARKELQEAKHDFGGHREKGLAAINDAIKQIDIILLNTGDNISGAPTRGDLKAEYKKYAHFPHLHHSLVELKHAHHQLKEARHDFGGHREAALRDIHHAIGQIEILILHHKKT